MNRAEYIDAVLEVTGGEAWELVKEGIKTDIRNVEVQELEAPLEDVMELRGFRRALIYVHDLRELAKLEKANDAL
jgi:hypothetical protein